ncbi:ABA4-like family protein [Rhodocytophaga aerolata]|uniref:ABA4-like family protein n=1 Tax=Rhodocytophaga aerolata TaxID=455078 RepID=A0ABT8R1N0_9BACT|nr:ABA4-like family protein [Rhodocytophaga aerolata]MDO1446002.1 ABA4-like family protein [Rhodocytophaga aerolata]
MSAEVLFSICSTLVLPQWLLLIFAPRWKWTKWLRDTYSIPLLLAVVYGYLIAAHMGEAPDSGFSSLTQVKNLFANDFLLLAGWIHYLAFDLVVGSWISKDAQQQGMSHLVVVPCLFFTFMLGPIGFLLYQLSKRIIVKKSASYESA